ncbi:MAG: MaoC family dehydratase [Pseudomonadota bacterium]
MAERYFEDFTAGNIFESRGVTLSESQILDFALTYDPQPFHIERPAAEASPYGGLIASGFQTLALGFRMFYQENIINACSIGSPGMDELRWLAPVRPGDTLYSVAEVLETRPSRSKPDRGSMTVGFTIKNQEGDAVMTFRTTMILLKRPDGGA